MVQPWMRVGDIASVGCRLGCQGEAEILRHGIHDPPGGSEWGLGVMGAVQQDAQSRHLH